MTIPNVQAVSGEDTAYRRVHPKQAPLDLDGIPRLSSAAFKPNASDAGELSVYLGGELAKIPAAPADCVAPGAPHTIAELGVADIQDLSHQVRHDPIIGSPTPSVCDPAHAVVTGYAEGRKEFDRQARKLRDIARWPV